MTAGTHFGLSLFTQTVPPCGLLSERLLASVGLFGNIPTDTTGGLSLRQVLVQSELTVALNHLRWWFLGTVLRLVRCH